jgi:hypothetical protein
MAKKSNRFFSENLLKIQKHMITCEKLLELLFGIILDSAVQMT